MQTGTSDIIPALGAWALGSAPLYRRLAGAFRAAIGRGDLPPETRLPAERALAQALTVSRSTVVAAYDALRQDGWIVSRRGSGTWVVPRPMDESDRRHATAIRILARNPWFTALVEDTAVPLDFATGTAATLPDLPAELFALSGEDLAPLLAERGYAPLGLPALRQAIAAQYTARGLPTTEAQVLVTTGAQQAITLVATGYLRCGDAVAVETPTYFGALDAFRAIGARPVPVPVNVHGVDVDLLRTRAVAASARLIYLMPTCHNPTGTIMPAFNRRAVAALAAEIGVPVVEDHTFADLTLGGDAPPPPIAAFGSGGTVVTIGSLSKSCWGGLRIGWIRAQQPVIHRLARLKVVTDLGSAVLSQAVAVRLVGQMGRIQVVRRAELLTRLALLEGLLAEWLPTWTWERPEGGFFLWVRLPIGDVREFAQAALRRGVIVTPGTALSIDDSHADRLRLPFLLPPEQLTAGVRRLAIAWKDHTASRSEPRRESAAII